MKIPGKTALVLALSFLLGLPALKPENRQQGAPVAATVVLDASAFLEIFPIKNTLADAASLKAPWLLYFTRGKTVTFGTFGI
ncbi:hypothetical protein BH24BAC1_BH24BAC1_30220 [soil metagenome]